MARVDTKDAEAKAATPAAADSNGNGSTGSNTPGRKPGTTNVPVTFGLKRVSKLPDKAAGGFPRNEALDGAMNEIKSNPDNHGVPFELATYGDDERAKSAASTKANGMRKKFTPEDGWVFRVGDSESETGRIGLFVQYS